MNEQGMSQNGWIESPEHNTDGNSLSALDVKTTDLFPGVTVRKDLVNKVKGNALVPSYVLEFLLSAYATNTDQASIESGVDRVRAILTNNYVHREEANLIQSKIREKGSHRIIDRVQVALNEKTDLYEATFSNLGISQVIVDPSLVKAYPKLLVTGIWCMCQIGYAYSGDPREVPWQLLQLKPVQMSRDDRENYMQQRSQFTDNEWIDLLMQSIGFNRSILRPGETAASGTHGAVCGTKLQSGRTRAERHRQIAHLLGILTARHAHIRRGSDSGQTVREQFQRTLGACGLLGYGGVRRVRRQGQEGRPGFGEHHEELHGQQVVLPWRRDVPRRGEHGVRRQHLA